MRIDDPAAGSGSTPDTGPPDSTVTLETVVLLWDVRGTITRGPVPSDTLTIATHYLVRDESVPVKRLLVPERVERRDLAADPTGSIVLIASDATGINPDTIYYEITTVLGGVTETKTVYLPKAESPINLADLVAVSTTTPPVFTAAETPGGAQAKADEALGQANAYTDAQLAGYFPGGGGGDAPGAGAVVEASLSPTFLRTIDAVLRWNGSGTQPTRSTVTADSLRRVRWVQPAAPPITAGYAIAGLDVWEQTP